MWKTLWQWLTGPDIFLAISQCPDSAVIEECVKRIPWLTDAQLKHLMDECEVESVNRLAQIFGDVV